MLQQLLLFIAFPITATIVGGILAILWAPGAIMRSYIQHFAAGVVFAAVAVELLPEIRAVGGRTLVGVGFAIGVALMLGMKWLLKGSSDNDGEGEYSITSLVATIGLDIFIDGLLIGIGFIAGAEQGKLLAVALTVELLFLGLAASAGLSRAGVRRWKAIVITIGLALLPGIGAVGGATLLSGLSGSWLAAVLSFGAAALLYLVTEELLVEAHEVPESPWTASMFFVGFLIVLLLEF